MLAQLSAFVAHRHGIASGITTFLLERLSRLEMAPSIGDTINRREININQLSEPDHRIT